MRLVDYLSARNETQVAFANRSGVAHRTVHRVCRGGRCGLTTAQAIVKATHERPTPSGGVVTFEELIPRESAA